MAGTSSQAAVGTVGGAVTPAPPRHVHRTGTPDHDSVRTSTFAGLLAQLVALLILIAQFQIENDAFLHLAALTIGGFAIHYFLPFRHRLTFFVGLSLAGIVMVLGVVQAAWLIGIGVALIGVAHLPVPFMLRVALLLGIGGALALPRWGLGSVPWSEAIWPVLGSMFVFRLMIYMYDLRHEARTWTWRHILGYFFLLPNICFPLFPVVDFKQFRRGYYDGERHAIYQSGVEWMWRGLMQLLLYRLVYYRFTIDSVDVANAADLAYYLLTTFLLYVRISGHFHLVIGMLHLFGFNLPETHHRYFLASSFTDFWRRINIYWKDFMLKLFYIPAYFRLKKLGETSALVLATLFTFIATWTLHLVQWFWIRGSVLIEWNDIIFWTIFALLVLFNSLYETRHARARSLSRRDRSLGEAVGLVARTAGTFVVICILWSFWTAESVSDWTLMARSAMTLPPWDPSTFALAAMATGGAAAAAVYWTWRGAGSGRREAVRLAPQTILATTALVCLSSTPAVTQRLGNGRELVDTIRLASAAALNQRDAERFQRGYYENLLDVGRFNDELWRVYERMPTDFVRSLSALGLTASLGDERDYELLPDKEGLFVGAMVRTNRWGMRDIDYSLERPPDTYRIALLGASIAMGSGVEMSDSFESVLEHRLNAGGPGHLRYEILNFGVAGYAPQHSLYQLQRRVPAFQPDAMFYVGHSNDLERASTQWLRMVRRGIVPDDAFLQRVTALSGIEPDTGPNEARRRARPYERQMLDWVYRSIVEECRRLGIPPIFVYLETVTEPIEEWRADSRRTVLDAAQAAGFTIFDLTGVYGDHDPADLWISPNDGHPNRMGNALIAARLEAVIAGQRLALGLPPGE